MDHDLVIIGGGSAGLVAAQVAAAVGASVALVEREPWPGGDCLRTGCVPSKALIAVANRAHGVRTAGAFGVHAVIDDVDFAQVMSAVRRAQDVIKPHDSYERLEAAGVTTLRGSATLMSRGRVCIDRVGEGSLVLTSRHVLVAAGSRPVMPPIPGADDSSVMTTDDVWSLDALPTRLLVIGGGSIGCELGQAFARLGSRVTIVESTDRLLAHEEPLASQLVTESLAADGVEVRVGCSVEQLIHGSAHLSDGTSVAFDRALVSVGRQASAASVLDDSAGVRLGTRGEVLVDARQRTSVRGVWAAGDVTGQLPFTNAAGSQGASAALNALLWMRRKFDAAVVPWVTYTDPEVGRVGMTEQGARERYGSDTVVLDLSLDRVDRSVTSGASTGFIRLVTTGGRTIVGATVVGRDGGEIMATLAAQVGRRGGVARLASQRHPYPTFSEATQHAALQLRRETALSERTKTWLTRVMRVTSRLS